MNRLRTLVIVCVLFSAPSRAIAVRRIGQLKEARQVELWISPLTVSAPASQLNWPAALAAKRVRPLPGRRRRLTTISAGRRARIVWPAANWIAVGSGRAGAVQWPKR